VGEFAIQIPEGKPISLAAYKGKPVLLAFILTTCPHCQHAVELLNKLQPEYAPRGLQMLASAIDQDAPEAVPLFIKNMHPLFPVGFSDPVATLNFAGYALTRLPHMPILLFIDRRGMVRNSTTAPSRSTSAIRRNRTCVSRSTLSWRRPNQRPRRQLLHLKRRTERRAHFWRFMQRRRSTEETLPPVAAPDAHAFILACRDSSRHLRMDSPASA